MAATGPQYTVFGFDSSIDWKPTVFVDGIPKNRLCSACGLVSAAVALLPCNHLLCNRCYDSSGDEERKRCPLDTQSCNPEDAIWSSFTRDKLLGRKIQCWNSRNGCDVVGPMCQVLDHFEQDCQYYAVTCFRCNRTMAYKGLADHLKENDCTIAEHSTASSSRSIPDATFELFSQGIGELRDKVSSLQTCFHETKELIVGQAQVFRDRGAAEALVVEAVQTLDNTLKESIAQSQAGTGCTAEELRLMRNSISTIMDTLCEVVVLVKEAKRSVNTSLAEHSSEVSLVCRGLQQNLNSLTASSAEGSQKTERVLDSLEKIGHERAKHEVDIEDKLKRLNERVTGDVSRKLSVLVNASKAFLQNTLSVSEPFILTIEKWSELKKEAASKGEAIALSEHSKYFYGYSILPGIAIEKTDVDFTLHLYYHVCRGDYDMLLDWPIKKDLMMQVLDAEKTEIDGSASVDTSIGCLEEHKMPTNGRNDSVWSNDYIQLTDIEKNGCVQDDKVFFKFSVSRL